MTALPRAVSSLHGGTRTTGLTRGRFFLGMFRGSENPAIQGRGPMPSEWLGAGRPGSEASCASAPSCMDSDKLFSVSALVS